MIKNYVVGDILTKAEYGNIQKKLLEKIKNKAELGPGNVYFSKEVKTSRRQFQQDNPENKIVKDKKEAKYHIGGVPDVSFYFGAANQEEFKESDMSDHWRYGRWQKLNNIIDFINSDVIYIHPKNIKLKASNGEIPTEMIEKIQLMLQSPDVETLNLGLSILFEYDHEINTDVFLVLLCKANYNTWWKRSKSRKTEPKIKWIKDKYLNKNF